MTRSQVIMNFLDSVEAENSSSLAQLGAGINDDIQTIRLVLLALTRFSKRELAELAKHATGTQLQNVRGKSYDVGILIGATERQTANDVEILMRSLHQRQGGALDPFVAALTQADRLVRKALSVLFDNGIADKVAAITYLGKIHDIQRVPYAPILMVGIPIWSAIDPLFMTAVAHEAGHYLHSESVPKYSRDSGASTNWPAKFAGWQEEIFADIVSILLAGPASAMSMLMIARRSSLSSLIEDDGVHPPPLLRLWVAHTVLTQAPVNQSPCASKLAEIIAAAIGSFTDAVRQKSPASPTTQTEAKAFPTEQVDSYQTTMVSYTENWLQDDTLAQLTGGNSARWTSGNGIGLSSSEDDIITALRGEMQNILDVPVPVAQRIGLGAVEDSSGKIIKLALINTRGELVEAKVFSDKELAEELSESYTPAILGPDWEADEGGTLISGRP